MNRKQLACRVLFLFVASGMPQNATIAETPCPCKNKLGAPTLPALNAFDAFNMAASQADSSIMTRLPNSWPRQWAGPTSNSPIATGQGNGVNGLTTSGPSTVGSTSNTKSSNAPANWPSQRVASRADSALISARTSVSATEPAIGSDAKTNSAFGANTKSSASGTSSYSGSPAYGGASGFGGGGGSAGAGSFAGGNTGGSSGGFAGGTASALRSSTSAGASGFGVGSGSSSGYLSTSQTGNAGSSAGSTKTHDSTGTPSPTTVPTPNPTPDPTPTPDPNPGDGGAGFSEVPPPTCDVPASMPEIPPTGGDPASIPDVTLGNGVGDTPVVPEPGSIVLLAIGAGVSGGAWLRRRKKLKAAAV